VGGGQWAVGSEQLGLVRGQRSEFKVREAHESIKPGVQRA